MTLEDTICKFKEDVEKELETGKLSFPSSFNIIERLTQLLEDENSALKQYSDLVQAEPVLLAKVLRMANTMGRTGAGKVTASPFTAIQRIGLKALSCLIYLNAMEYAKSEITDRDKRWMMISIWKHSIDVGCWSYCFSQETAKEDPDTAMLGGVMSNIGHFFLLYKLSKYPAIEAYSETFDSIMNEYTYRVTQQLLDIFILPAEVITAFNTDTTNMDVWPPSCLSHLVCLGKVTTELQNPLIHASETVKKKLFLQNLDLVEARKYNRALQHVAKDRRELYAIFCQE